VAKEQPKPTTMTPDGPAAGAPASGLLLRVEPLPGASDRGRATGSLADNDGSDRGQVAGRLADNDGSDR
jgi:hypothetical protein